MPIIDFSSANSNFTWIDVVAPNEEELLRLGTEYNIHPYSIKDCLEPDHLPKYEIQEEYSFIISRLWIESKSIEKIETIQQATSKMALFFGDNFVISIHRLPLEFMHEIHNKYYLPNRCKTTGDLVVRLLWYVLSTYTIPSREMGNEIDQYEEQIFLKSLNPHLMKKLYFLKRKVHIANKLLQMNHNIVQNMNSKDKIALHDLRDLQVHLQSEYSQSLDDVTNLLHFYMSISSQKTNEVMRILTVFSAFFLPLTFIVGVYGMNFKYMPELEYIHGYKLTWLFMILTTILIFQWFWRKKWL